VGNHIPLFVVAFAVMGGMHRWMEKLRMLAMKRLLLKDYPPHCGFVEQPSIVRSKSIIDLIVVF
jgi:hypothetical protein